MGRITSVDFAGVNVPLCKGGRPPNAAGDAHTRRFTCPLSYLVSAYWVTGLSDKYTRHSTRQHLTLCRSAIRSQLRRSTPQPEDGNVSKYPTTDTLLDQRYGVRILSS